MGNKTSYGYDALNRQISVQNPDGVITTTAYDANDNVLTVTDELGPSTDYVYDVFCTFRENLTLMRPDQAGA